MTLPSRITAVPGIRVGHWTSHDALTGCTVILFPPGARGGIHVGGSAPATRDTRLLDPGSRIDEVHALLFTGGSAFGLDAAGGVMRFLEKRGIGHITSAGVVPIVPAAAIYDLNRGDASVRPGAQEGEEAAATASEQFDAGAVGAGAGASCSKWMGVEKSLPAGIGTAAAAFGDLVVGALAVVNPVGDIIDEKGKVLLGVDAPRHLRLPDLGQNTVLTAVASNGRLGKLQCIQAAQRIQDGVARSIYPSRTKHDGDAGFFISCGEIQVDVTAAAIRAAAKR
jgi:L-aminopeptidase/D-esterase-like protein